MEKDYYLPEKWYYYPSSDKDYVDIAKFVGFTTCYSRPRECDKCPGKLLFEGRKPKCSNMSDGTLEKINWIKVPTEYLWAVELLEQTLDLIKGQRKHISITTHDGFTIETKIKEPSKESLKPGKWSTLLLIKKTGEKKEGWLIFPGPSEKGKNVFEYLQNRTGGCEILKLEPKWKGIQKLKK